MDSESCTQAFTTEAQGALRPSVIFLAMYSAPRRGACPDRTTVVSAHRCACGFPPWGGGGRSRRARGRGGSSDRPDSESGAGFGGSPAGSPCLLGVSSDLRPPGQAPFKRSSAVNPDEGRLQGQYVWVRRYPGMALCVLRVSAVGYPSGRSKIAGSTSGFTTTRFTVAVTKGSPLWVVRATDGNPMPSASVNESYRKETRVGPLAPLPW